MKKYKLKDFDKWAKKEKILDDKLQEIIREMNRGLLGDRLGANVYKKRFSTEGSGKRGGGRVIVLFKHNELILFLYGYNKNELANINMKEERQLRLFANEFVRLSFQQREKLVLEDKLIIME